MPSAPTWRTATTRRWRRMISQDRSSAWTGSSSELPCTVWSPTWTRPCICASGAMWTSTRRRARPSMQSPR
eukprot:2932792-Pyramimonas_sp.AAC.1